MIARVLLGAALAGSLSLPALSAEMNAEEARSFVAGKVFSFSCFDGTRGAGRIFDDGGAAGAVQFSGSGPSRNMRLPVNTLQVRGKAICASIKGLPFEPCFNLKKQDDRSFRGAISGMGFAYCDFRHQGASQMLMARASRKKGRSPTGDAEANVGSVTEVANRVETPRVDIGKIEPVRKSRPSAPRAEPLELRRSTD